MDNHIQMETGLPIPYSQISVINYSQLVQGKPVIIYSSTSARTQSVNGKVNIGLMKNLRMKNNMGI